MRIIESKPNFFITDNIYDTQSGFRLLGPVRKRINAEFYKMVYNTYFDAIPLQDISDILNVYNIFLIQEDGLPWSGFLLGDSSQTQIDLAQYDGESDSYSWIKNANLQLQWYKMESGHYEINTYVG